MANGCTICEHPSRAAIERAMLNGRTTRDIAATFSTPDRHLGRSTVSRHKPHVAMSLQEVAQTRGLASADNLVALVEGLVQELGEVKAHAKLQPNGGPEVRKNVEAILKAVQVLADLTGANAPRVNVQVQATAAPTLDEATSLSKECLLAMLDAQQMRSFASELLQRASEDDHLLLEGNAGDCQSQAPEEPQLSPAESKDCEQP